MQNLLIVLGFLFAPVTGSLMVLWRSSRRRAERAEIIIDEIALARATASRPDATIEQIQRRMDGIADEVDRLASGQRYLVQMLSDRRGPEIQLPPRLVTPH